MAYSQQPADWFGAGYSLGTNQMIFNTSNHATPATAEASNTNANATTGDVRQVIFAILNKAYNHYLSVASVDRPAKMVMNRNTSEDSTGHMVRTFTVSFVLDETSPGSIDAE